VKFHFIAAYRTEFRVRSLCRVLGVSPSGFYAWARRSPPRQAQRNDALLVHIRAAHAVSRRTDGAPRIHRELQAQGISAGRHRIARLMRREAARLDQRRHSLEQAVGQCLAHPRHAACGARASHLRNLECLLWPGALGLAR
jgi:putative transposase